jgi:hypothetical protein
MKCLFRVIQIYKKKFADFFSVLEIFQKNLLEEFHTHILCSINLFTSSCHMLDKAKKLR